MKLVVNIADMKLSSRPGDVIVTHALGSCLGVTLYDPKLKIGALAHLMMPTAQLDEARARFNPYLFVDTGFERLLEECMRMGMDKRRIAIAAAGGATPNGVMNGEDFFQIGKKNIVILRKILWTKGLLLKGSDFGGISSREMRLDTSTGKVTIKTMGCASCVVETGRRSNGR